eukprot:TRINITY_DN4699_c0_g1_i2.p4 TRINITY_DN4699_c0_g1~~TRINITY_DN4699_c0_g1_i2.p4  ORF type:complete len:143 (-),score=17.35 TRINITY_DN4699_c0_g1_i2:896-1261(-)
MCIRDRCDSWGDLRHCIKRSFGDDVSQQVAFGDLTDEPVFVIPNNDYLVSLEKRDEQLRVLILINRGKVISRDACNTDLGSWNISSFFASHFFCDSPAGCSSNDHMVVCYNDRVDTFVEHL